MEIAERIRSGMTAVNGVITFAAIPSLPFGGVGDSGFGRIHGADGLREFSYAHAIARQRFKPMMNLTSFTRTAKQDRQLTRLVKLLHGRGSEEVPLALVGVAVSHPSSRSTSHSRGRALSLSQRLGRLRVRSWQVGQCAVAAGVAWYVAADVFGHDRRSSRRSRPWSRSAPATVSGCAGWAR